MEKRISWIDTAKFWGIILVIFGHVGYNGFFYYFLHSFHMPLFFILSGFFASPKIQSWRSFFIKNTSRLLIPYLFFYIIGTPANIVSIIRHPELYPDYSFYELISKSFMGMLFGCEKCFNDSSFIMSNGPLWFLLVLFIIKVIFHFVTLISGSLPFYFFSCIISFLAYYSIKDYLWANIWHLKSAFFCYQYYVLGFFLNKLLNFPVIISCIPKVLCFVLSCFFFFLVAINVPISIPIKYVDPIFSCSIMLSFFLALCGSMAVSLLSCCFPSVKIFVDIGKGTLCIMGIHLTILSAVKIVLLYLGIPALSYSFFISMIETLLTLLLSFFCFLFLRKRCPLLIGFENDSVRISKSHEIAFEQK